MLVPMSVVGILILQRYIALVAVVGHLALVIAQHVLIQIGNDFELLPTLVALVRVLSGVH